MTQSPLVLVGPSGSGKTTLARLLVDQEPEQFSFSVSATTRSPREGERHGVDYLFVTRTEFEELIEGGRMAEWAEVHGNLYGTPVSSLKSEASAGRTPILDIDVQGALEVRRQMPDTSPVFVLPPDSSVWLNRLVGRGTEDREELMRRLATALDELRSAHLFERFVVNVDLDVALRDIKALHSGRDGYGISSLQAEALCSDLSSGAEQALKDYQDQGPT